MRITKLAALSILAASLRVAAIEHPCLFIDQGEIDAIKAKVSAMEEPWASAYTALLVTADTALGNDLQLITAGDHRIPQDSGGGSDPDYPILNAARDDFTNIALAWKFSGDTDYRDRALEYIDAFFITEETATVPYYQDGVYGTWLMSGMLYAVDLIWNDMDAGQQAALTTWIGSYHDELLDSAEAQNYGIGTNHNRADWFSQTLALTSVLTEDAANLAAALGHFQSRAILGSGKFNGVGGSTAVPNDPVVGHDGTEDTFRNISYGHYALAATIQLLEIGRHNGTDLYEYDVVGDDSKIRRICNWYQRFTHDLISGPALSDNEKEIYEIPLVRWGDANYQNAVDEVGRPINVDSHGWTNLRAITLTHSLLGESGGSPAGGTLTVSGTLTVGGSP